MLTILENSLSFKVLKKKHWNVQWVECLKEKKDTDFLMHFMVVIRVLHFVFYL